MIIEVENGDTWESISTAYEVPVDCLKKINPGFTLQEGCLIFIPVHHNSDTQTVQENDEKSLRIKGEHHFQKGQKLFSEKKYVDAVNFFNDAASCGDENAKYMLGYCYENGLGVKKDISQATQIYRSINGSGNIKLVNHKAHEALNKIKIANAPELKDVKFVYTPGDYDKVAEKMEFIKDGKVLFYVTAKVDRLCFMQEIASDKNANVMRIVFSDKHAEKNFDFRSMLLDLHGNDDFRYLMIADHHTGNSTSGHKIYIVDAKDNFKFIAEIDGGEIIDLPYPMQSWVFSKDILFLGYFGARGGEAIVRVQIDYGQKTPEVIYDRITLTADDIAKLIRYYQGMYAEGAEYNRQEMAITFLYADMLETGNFKFARGIAEKIGYSQEYVDKFHAGIVKQIKESENRSIIEKLNDIDLSKI